ncbi:hypothetical protein [Pseudomonas sp.]|uniref:hypothetical protein n=1 Tax=Pseudomonas sp. TaxID=306 RepID=UPI002587F9DA|nr:hypothetical protein [Pseudomonas sp.]
MKITFDLTLTPQETAEIGQIIGCLPADVPAALGNYGKAALREYLAMMRGQKALKRGTDIHEYRLFLLVDTVFAGQIPDEQTISKIFQTTATESRGLLRSIISKYQYLLRDAIDHTLKDVLQGATAETANGPFLVTMNSVNVIEELNKKLAAIDGTLPSIAKKRGSVATYEILKSSYEQLCAQLGATPAVYVP